MTIGGQDLLSILVVCLISFFAGTVKTVLLYTRGGSPRKIDYTVNIILSFFVGVLSSFVSKYFGLPDELLYVAVALSALSAERLLSAIPTIFTKKLEDAFGVHPTQDEYKNDPINNKPEQK